MAELTWQAAAAAHILEARKKKGRGVIRSRKSRAGCLTCKTRRVKCDEKHPECGNCTSTGRKCGGYLEENKKSQRTLIGLQLSQTLGLKENEIRTFDYFLSWSAPRMAGSLDKEFWCGQVLQVAQCEPIVLDALLAISTLYEHPQFMKSFYPPRDTEKSTKTRHQSGTIVQPAMSRPPLDEFHADALMHYNRAMRRFKERLDEGKATPLLALLTCALFICTEVIRDNVFGALVLFTQGVKLLKEYEPGADSAETSLFTNLRLMFARLGLQTALFGHSGRVEVPHDRIDGENGFSNILSARTSLYALSIDVHDCIRDAADFRAGPGTNLPPTDFVDDYPNETVHPDEDRYSPDGITRLYYGCVDDETAAPQLSRAWGNDLPPRTSLATRTLPWYHPSQEILERKTGLKQRLRNWYEAFKNSSFAETEDETTTNLLMHYNLFTIWLDCCLSPFESAYDQFTLEFEEVLRLADVFIKCKADRPTFVSADPLVVHGFSEII